MAHILWQYLLKNYDRQKWPYIVMFCLISTVISFYSFSNSGNHVEFLYYASFTKSNSNVLNQALFAAFFLWFFPGCVLALIFPRHSSFLPLFPCFLGQPLCANYYLKHVILLHHMSIAYTYVLMTVVAICD